ncbi:MAG: hypothetical protein CR991_10225 [Proteobacteria bacterium]|nr:MAG: hypothetical protein CR991_10225 [Pseudomonadota bacterium]
MKKIFMALALATSLTMPCFADEDKADGLNVIVTSGEPQTQMMSMVLSMMTIEKLNKKVNMVLCDKAGTLALKDSDSPVVKAMDASPKQVMQQLISKGMDVKLCPLYLPSIGKDESVLIKGVEVADPAKVAARLLNKNFNILSY